MDVGVRADRKVREAVERAIEALGLKDFSERCGIEPERLSSLIRRRVVPLRIVEVACEVNRERDLRGSYPPYTKDLLECIKGCLVEEVEEEEEGEGVKVGLFNVGWRDLARFTNLAIDMLAITVVSWYAGKSLLPRFFGVAPEVGEAVGAITGALLSTAWAALKVVKWSEGGSKD